MFDELMALRPAMLILGLSVFLLMAFINMAVLAIKGRWPSQNPL